MASATISLLSVCTGGEHVNVRLAVGANDFDFSFEVAELLVAISPEERKQVTSIMSRFHCQGLTKVQAKAELLAGIQVTTA